MSFEHTGVHNFTLSDARGESHAYLVTEHPAGEGMEIMFAVLALSTPSVMTLAGAAMKSSGLLASVVTALTGRGDEASDGSSDMSDLLRMLGDIDLASVGHEIARSLGTGKAPDLTKRVLSRVLRDGKPLNIDLAYQANYFEMLQAVWRVCQINRFFPLPSTSPSASTERTLVTDQ